MTREAAIDYFFSSFGIPSYKEGNVPADAPFPYLTYTVSIGNTVIISANLYYRTESEVPINNKSREIRNAILDGGKMVSYDGGAYWVKEGEPFSIDIPDDTDKLIRRKVLNIEFEKC